MSDNLKAFLAAYIEWVEAGAGESDVFDRFAGLCSNFRWHMADMHVPECESEAEVNDLKHLFSAEGLDEEYPFGGQDQYLYEADAETAHLNEARLSWVRSKVAQLAEV
jgi:hypothetical protein